MTLFIFFSFHDFSMTFHDFPWLWEPWGMLCWWPNDSSRLWWNWQFCEKIWKFESPRSFHRSREVYNNNLTVWVTWLKNMDMQASINSYLEEITEYMKDSPCWFLPQSHVVQPGHTPSQDPSKNTHRGLRATTGPMPKDFRSPPGHLTIIQHAYQLRSRESIQQKQYPQGFCCYILGTTEKRTANDIQGGWETDHQLRCTCLEHKPTRHQLQKHTIHT